MGEDDYLARMRQSVACARRAHARILKMKAPSPHLITQRHLRRQYMNLARFWRHQWLAKFAQSG